MSEDALRDQAIKEMKKELNSD